MNFSTPHRKTLIPRPLLHILAAVGFIGFVVLILAFNALLVWVATGPRDLKSMLPYLESSLNSEGSNYVVTVGEGVLLWDGWQHPLDIRLRKVDVKTREGIRFAAFPEVSLGLNFFALIYGKVEAESLVIRRPVMSLFQAEDGAVTFGFNPDQAATAETPDADPNATNSQEAVLATIAGFFNGNDKLGLHALKHVEISEADVSVGNLKGVFLTAHHVNLSLQQGWRGARLKFSALVKQPERDARLSAEISRRRSNTDIETMLQVESLQPATVNPFVRDETVLAGLTAPVSAWVNATVSEAGIIKQGKYSLNIGAGALTSKALEKTVEFSHLDSEGVFTPSAVVIQRLGLTLASGEVQGKGGVQWGSGEVAIQADASMTGAHISDIRAYWPPSLAPESRAWLVENLKSGDIPLATIHLDIKPGELNLPFLPEKAIDANMNVSRLVATYLPEHEPIREGEGSAHVNGTSMQVRINQASTMTGTKISNGLIAIDDLNVDNPRIDMKFDVSAPSADVVRLLELPPLGHAKRLNMSAEKSGGSITGNANISFYFTAPLDEQGKPRDDMGVTFDIRGNVAQVSQPGFMNRFDISDATGEMTADNAHLTFKGSGVVNDARASAAEIEYWFKPKEGYDTFLKVDGRAPVAALKRFGYPEFAWLSGTVGVSAQMKQGPAAEDTTATIDLKDAMIDWKDLAWKKAAGEAATLKLTAEKRDGRTSIRALSYKAADAQAEGSMQLTQTGDLQEITLDRVTIGRNDLAFTYAIIPGGYRISAKGKSGDLTGWMSSGDDFTFKAAPALELDVDLEKLYLTAAAPLSQVKGTLTCSTEYCSAASLSGIAGKPFSVRIAKAGAARKIEVRADDAGTFLSSVGIYDTMKNGVLSLNGTYNDATAAHTLTGVLNISDYAIEHAPALAKLLTLSSLSSFVDTLQGKGIQFAKLNAPFTLENDVITLTDAKAFGSAIGISAEGTITFPGEVLAIKGTVVPSYTLNTVLGNVPIIGDIITGGGEGVIGARYTMKGKAAEADVSVNPLSLLTPGFLRGLFDVFDGPSPAKPKSKKSGSNPKTESPLKPDINDARH